MEPHWSDGIELKVVEGYKARGVSATSRCFKPAESDGPCCAWGALSIGVDDTLEEVARANGCTDRQQAWAFAAGFDQAMEGKSWSCRHVGTLSFNAGVRTAKAVIDAGLRIR